MDYQLHQGDCQQFLADEPAGKYDLLLIDPPYRTTNLGFDKAPGLNWATWWPQAWRVLKPTGVIVVFAADLFTVDLIQSQRENYRYRMHWEKTRKTGFLDAPRRPMRDVEDIVVFTKRPLESTYNPQKTPRPGPNKTRPGRLCVGTEHYSAHTEIAYVDDNLRYPGLVLRFGSGDNAKNLHPTQKPLDLMRWLVRTYSNPGDTVLDCFAGSGSTLHACLLENRYGVGVEQDAKYYASAEARMRGISAQPQLFT